MRRSARPWRSWRCHPSSAAIGGSPACQPLIQIEHAAAPGAHRIVGGQQLEIADRAGPLERAEHDVIGIGRRLAAETKSWRSTVRRSGSRLARKAGSRASRSLTTSSSAAPKRFSRSCRKYAWSSGPRWRWMSTSTSRISPFCNYGLGPVLDEARQRAAGLAAEQRRAVGIALFEIVGDRGRIVHDPVAIDDDRHAAGIRAAAACPFR